MYNNRYFDKTDVYEERIKSIMDDLKIACGANRMPMFAVVAVSYGIDPETGKEKTTYKKVCLRAETEALREKEAISDMILRVTGCRATLPAYIVDAAATLREFLDRLEIDERLSARLDNEMTEEDARLYDELDRKLCLFEERGEIPENVKESASKIRDFLSDKTKKDITDIPETSDDLIGDLNLIAMGGGTELPESVRDAGLEEAANWEDDVLGLFSDGPEEE